MEKKKIATPPTPKAKEGPGSNANLWRRRSVDDVYFQRETVVTFMSILGGVAVGALLTQFIPMIEQIRDSRWQLILFFIASIFVMINSWVQISWATLVIKSQISFPTLIPEFMASFFTAVMCLMLTNPSGWFAAVGATMLSHLIPALIDSFKRTDIREHVSQQIRKEIKSFDLVSIFIMLIVFSASAHLYFHPSNINEIIWGVVALFFSIAAMVQQHRIMERERKELGIP